MPTTLEPPPLDIPDAGVIEEARARQRRQHRMVGGAAFTVAAVGAILFASIGGGGTSRSTGVPPPSRPQPAKAGQSARAACLSTGRELQGAPRRSLLSILGVLRRPATAADALPQSLAGRGLIRDVFVRYVRRTRVINGSPYYIYPALVGGCGVEPARQGIRDLATHVELGGGAIGGSGGGGSTATDIEQGRAVGTGPPGSSTSATITMIVPDGVASVTLPAARAATAQRSRRPSRSQALRSAMSSWCWSRAVEEVALSGSPR